MMFGTLPSPWLDALRFVNVYPSDLLLTKELQDPTDAWNLYFVHLLTILEGVFQSLVGRVYQGQLLKAILCVYVESYLISFR